MPPLVRTLLAEALGTFILILFGCGAVHAAVLTGAQSGLWQVAIVWGMGVALAAYSVGGVSGSWVSGRLPMRDVGLLVYIMVDSVTSAVDAVVANGGEIDDRNDQKK